MKDKPEDVRHIVMSVPHMGTRTLKTYLSETRPETVPDNKDQIGHWHFGMHPDYIQRFFAHGKGMAYIPMRNPCRVADSWQRRYGSAIDKTAKEMIEAMGMMAMCINNHRDHIELFKMEDLPVLKGIGPRPENWDDAETGPRLEQIRRWVRADEGVESLWRTYYTAQELYWL